MQNCLCLDVVVKCGMSVHTCVRVNTRVDLYVYLHAEMFFCIICGFAAKKLQRLSLAENPVCEVQYYKSFLLYHMPQLRFLDFKRIRDEDRKLAQQTFEGEKGKKLIQEIGERAAEVTYLYMATPVLHIHVCTNMRDVYTCTYSFV